MSSYAFYVVYDGPALQGNQMDVRDLAPALLALSDAFEEANRVINGSQTEIRLDVKASFQTGCFGIDLVSTQGVLNTLANWAQGVDISSAADIATLLGFSGAGVLHAIKWVKGRKITKITVKDGKARVYIDEDFIEVEEKVISLFRNTKIRDSFEEVITKPLSKEGIDSFGFTSGKKDLSPSCTIKKEEAEYFKAPPVEDEMLDEREYETSVQIVGISFQEKNKWRFSDGSSPFYSDIVDENFMARVNNHQISFAKDDLLKVVMQEKQKLTKDGIKTEKSILKVLSHRSAQRQLDLPFETSQDK